MNTLEIYDNISGLRVNTDKTQIVWIGKAKLSKDKFKTKSSLLWGSSEFTLLGTCFSVNLASIEDLNYNPLIANIKEMLARWKKRYLTPIGKIKVIKTLVLSKFTHLFISLPRPNQKVMNSLLFKFIWDDKPDKISREQLTKNYSLGGLNMIALDQFITALKVTWLRRLSTNKEPPWAKLLERNTISIKKLLLLGPSCPKDILNCITNPFWQDVVQSWVAVTLKIPINNLSNLLCSPYGIIRK